MHSSLPKRRYILECSAMTSQARWYGVPVSPCMICIISISGYSKRSAKQIKENCPFWFRVCKTLTKFILYARRKINYLNPFRTTLFSVLAEGGGVDSTPLRFFWKLVGRILYMQICYHSKKFQLWGCWKRPQNLTFKNVEDQN